MDSEQAAAKSRILAKGRKIERDLQRYAAFGYLTPDAEAWEKDETKLIRAIDGLYDSARKSGIHGDPELMHVRDALRAARRDASERARESRRQLREGQAARLQRREVPGGMQGYLDEIKIGEAKRRARGGR